MVLECGKLLLVFSDNALFEFHSIGIYYQLIDIEVISTTKRYNLTIRIVEGLTYEQRLQAIVVHTIARITSNPEKTKDAYLFKYISNEIRLKDWNNGYWENIMSKDKTLINLGSSMIIGYGYIA